MIGSMDRRRFVVTLASCSPMLLSAALFAAAPSPAAAPANEILFENLRDVVLVGHSYRGMVISGVAEKLPERIRRLIYLDAVVPEDGESILGRPRSAEGLLKSMVVRLRGMMNDGFLIPPWVSAGSRVYQISADKKPATHVQLLHPPFTESTDWMNSVTPCGEAVSP
jgi:pimeloyl-ACP methyl ester carboxylesterase